FFRPCFPFTIASRVHGSFYVVPRRHPAVGWIFRKILFVQRGATRWGQSGASLARRAWSRWQFRFAVLLPSRVESNFCLRPLLRGSGTDGARAIRFFAARYGHGACHGSCFPRCDAERFGIAYCGRDTIRNRKKMQLTLDPCTVSFASKVRVSLRS